MAGYTDDLVERLDVGPDADVLEVGAGSGVLSEALAPHVNSVFATDFSPAMVDVLRERMQESELRNVEAAVMDGQSLDVEDGTFDAAACSFALMLFPDREKGFSELCRAVRPGGRAVVSGWAGPDRFESFGLFLEAMRMAFPDMPAPDSPPPVFSLADPSGFKTEMEAGGFSNVEVEFVGRDLTMSDFDEMWGMLTAGAPPVKVLFDRIGTSGRERLRNALQQIVRERFGDGPITTTNVATVASGIAK
jgi:SAM-dependent methyltransferase